MPVKRALNLITIRQAPLARKLELARAAGYDGVGLWVDDIEAATRSGADLATIARLLRAHSLIAAELCLVDGWMYPEEGQRDRLRARTEQVFHIAQALGCRCVVACASLDAGELEDAARDFAELCARARPLGVKVALEFIGAAQQVKDVRTAWQIVDLADAPNGGLLIDTFHFFAGGSEVTDLEELPAESILVVHVSDCPDMPREEMQDSDRVFPGTGALALEALAVALRERGYDGFFSLELFNEAYWATEPYLIAQEGMRSLRRVGI